MVLRLTVLVALAITALGQPSDDSAAAAAEPAAAAAVTDAPTAAPTPSPLEKYQSAKKAADAAMAGLESVVADLKAAADDQSKIDALGFSILEATGTDKHGIRNSRDRQFADVKKLANAASSAAANMGEAAGAVRDARQASGGNATLYEASYAKRSSASKQMQSHSEDLRKESDRYLKDIYHKVEKQIKEAHKGAKRERKEEERAAEQKSELGTYRKQAEANEIAAKEAAAAKAKAEAEADAAKAEADAQAAASEQAAQEAAAKEAQLAAARAKVAVAAAQKLASEKEAAAEKQAADAAAQQPGPAGDASQPASAGAVAKDSAAAKSELRGSAQTAMAAVPAAEVGFAKLGRFVVASAACGALLAVGAGVRAYVARPEPQINTYALLG